MWPLFAKKPHKRFLIHTFIGLLFDIVDWAMVGLVPVAGDLVDAVATLYWAKVLGPVGLMAAVEFIPFGADLLPTNIVLGLYADSKKKKFPFSPGKR